jgi:hypothetical protein
MMFERTCVCVCALHMDSWGETFANGGKKDSPGRDVVKCADDQQLGILNLVHDCPICCESAQLVPNVGHARLAVAGAVVFDGIDLVLIKPAFDHLQHDAELTGLLLDLVNWEACRLSVVWAWAKSAVGLTAVVSSWIHVATGTGDFLSLHM